MKKYLATILCFFLLFPLTYAQNETWSGELEVSGVKLPLVFHLDDTDSTVDSPAQGAKGIPIQIDKNSEGEILISIPLIGANFEGRYIDNRIEGTFKQNGFSLPLVLHPGEEKPKRPQTPKPPFPYSQEEVSFTNGDTVLKGTLTLPEKYNADTPVVLMVTGSGLQNRDEEIFEHKPFAVIADALARAGVASLRYDDRGYGESTGDAVNSTTEDLMNDALAGIFLLRQRFNKVGVLGHSEGGTIAMMLAAKQQPDFIVSMAGMVVSGKETLMDQNQYALKEAGLPEPVVNEYCRLLSGIFDRDEDAVRNIEDSDLTDALKQNLRVVVQQAKTPYMECFLNLDMRDKLKDIHCPVFAINGEKDTQVYYKANLEALNKGLAENNLNFIKSFKGLNHLFQHCETGAVTEYALIEETISPEVLNQISDWILNL